MTRPWQNPAGTPAAAIIVRRIASAVPQLTTARTILRAPRIDDYPTYARIATTERGKFIGGPMSDEDAWLDFCQMVAGWSLRGTGVWTVTPRSDDKAIGFIPLDHEYGDPEPEIGFLFAAAAEGQGLAFEAATAARNFAFGTLGLPTLVSYIDPANTRSVALAERLGATPDLKAAAALDEPVQVYRHTNPKGTT
jgi:RimJ/RimL family protein N-acetyltransferase